MVDKLTQFQEIINQSQHLVFFGGAGVSTESGIPDFRSADGIFMQETGTNYLPEQIISHSFFEQHPKTFFDFYFKKLIYPEAKYNVTHEYLATLEQKGKNVTIITQNIDGLHQDAGSSRVIELHGTVRDNYCLTCGHHYTLEELERDGDGIPRCIQDGGVVRPNVVLYEEGLNQNDLTQAIQAISEAELLIVAGTSLAVYPAAGLINYFNGDSLVVINKSPLNIAREAIVFEDNMANVFSKLT